MDDASHWYDLARSALEREAVGSTDPAVLAEALGRLWARLYRRVARLLGAGGFRAIATRALREAQSRFPFLIGVGLGPEDDAPLIGLQDGVRGQDPEQVARACTALLAGILALLFYLLGSDITRRILRAAWPGIGCDQGCSAPGK